MNKVALVVGAGCAAAATVGLLAQRPPATAPVAVPAPAAGAEAHGGQRMEDGPSLEGEWRDALAASAAGDDAVLWEVARRWLASDPAAAMDAVWGLEGRVERKRWALSLWQEADIQAAGEWTAKVPGVDGMALHLHAFEVFAARNPVAAMDVASRRTNPTERLWLAIRTLPALARVDPATAWREARNVPLPSEWFERHWGRERRSELSMAVLDVWTESGWGEPLRAVAATEGAHVPERWQYAAIARWAKAAPLAALEWASGLPPFDASDHVRGTPTRRQAMGAAFAAMAIHWPHKGNAAMEEIGDWRNRERQGIYNSNGYRDAIRHFVETTDPRRLTAWFDNHPDAAMRRRHAADVARAYAASHPREALDWALRLPAGKQQVEAVWGAATAIPENDYAQVAEMLTDIGDASLVKQLAHPLVRAWVKEDPAAAIGWSEAHAPRMATFHTWAIREPAVAAAHLPKIVDARSRAWATRHVIDGTFLGVDDEALRPHLPRLERLYATLPADLRSKHVAYFLYRHYEHADPERAALYKAEARDDHGDPWDFQ